MKKIRHFEITFLTLFLNLSTLILSAQTYTFTSAGVDGQNGPTQTQVNNAYSSTSLDGKVIVNGGIQYWVVPATGLYHMEATGAQGYGPYGGRGAKMEGEFMLLGGDTLKVLVGQKAGDYLNYPATTYNAQYGGGGGSFVTLSNNTPLIIAGGGGGNHGTSYSSSCDGQTGTGGAAGSNATTTGNGGSSGSGGLAATSADGGGGLLTDGAGNAGGKSFLIGSTGGGQYGFGGFGGGGGTSSYNNFRGGGGGGYSGGGAANNGTACCPTAGGGGSYNAGNNQNNIAGVGLGNGSVVITTLSTGATNDIGVISIDSPNVYCPGIHNVVATIQNFGTNIIDSVTLNWSVDGIAKPSVKYIGTLDTIGGTGSPIAQVLIGNFNFTSSPHQVNVWSSLPNGVADTSNQNDTSKATKQSSLPPPTSIAALSITDTSATIGWAGGSTSNSWLYVNMASGMAPSGIGTSVAIDSVKITGLTRSTSYDFYVREVCPTGDTSIWAGPYTYKTPCSTPLNGTYTINPGQPVSSSNFVSFEDALGALVSCGISGPVTFNVAPNTGPYPSGAEITTISGSSATNTVTFNGNGNIINEGVATYFVALNGVSYMTINDFKLINTNPATPMFGIMIRGGSHHINITNNMIDMGMGSTSTASACIAVSNSTTSATTAGNNGQYITITDNELAGGYYSVTLIGNSSYADNYKHLISGNIIRDYYVYGVYMVNADSIIVEKNDFSRPNRPTLTTFYATYLSSSRGVKIMENKIHGSGAGSYTAYPIYITTSVNNSGNKTEIINNMIYDIRTTGTIYGMYLLGTRDYINIYHNTIDLVSEGTGTKRAIFLSSAPNNHDLKNNIVSMTGDGTGTKHLIYVSTTSTSFTSNNNVWYMGATAGTNYMGYWSAARTALSDWQTNVSQDANSVDNNPVFANSANGNLIPLSSAVDNIGTPVGVLSDIANTTRSTTSPDAGAYEFVGLAGDLGLVSGELIRVDLCYNTTDTAEFVITNLFGATVNFSTNPLKLVWKVSGPVISTDTILINSGSLAASASMNISTYSVDMTAPGTYTLTAHILPNTTNPSTYNDTLATSSEQTVVPVLSVEPALTTLTSYPDSIQLTAISPLITSGGGLTTSWGSNNGSGGNYFDIKVDNGIVLTGFDVNNSSVTSITYDIYYRRGSYNGHESDSSGWLSLGSYGVTGAGLDNPTEVTLSNQLLLLPDTYAFYIVTTNGGHRYIGATGATVAGAVWATNSDLTIFEGLGCDNVPFSTTTFSPRNFSGTIKYAPPSQVITGLVWKEGTTTIDSTRSIWAGPYNTHGTHTYVASFTNVCGTFTDTATVIMPPRVDMALGEIILPAQECQLVNLPVEVKISNASLIEAIDFGADSATVTVNVTGAATQSYQMVISNNTMNGNMPLNKGKDLLISLGNLNLAAIGTYYFNASVLVSADGATGNNVMLDSLTVNPTPIVNAGLDQKACPGATVNLNASASNGTGFFYNWSPGGGLTDSTVSNPSFTASTTKSLMLTVTNAEGCTTTDNLLVEVSTVATDAGADFQVCSGSPVAIGVTNGGTGGFGNLSYSWSPGVYLSDSTINKPTATVNSSTIFTLTVTDSLGCKATDNMEVQALSVPSPSVTGPNAACGTHTETYSTSLDAGTTYQWQVTNGTIVGSSTGNSVNVKWNASGTGNVKVTQTITAGGCFKTTSDYFVTINPLPTAVIFPITPTTICAGGNATLVTIPSTGVSYQWKKDGIDIPGATSSTLNTSQAGDYKLIATSSTGCKDSSSTVSIVVNSAPLATITPASTTTFCAGASVKLDANTGTGLTYQWILNSAAISGATSASYTASTSGDYQAKVTNSNGCEATSSIIPVTVKPLPSASISASGATTFCQGGNVSMAAFAGTGYTYQWRQNSSNIFGATASTLNVTGSGNYDVKVTLQGCEATSNIISVTVNTLPTATATAGGATTFCTGGNVDINANTGTGLSYLWMRDGTNIPGATSSSYNATQSGSYSVKVTNSNSCSNVSAPVVVTVNPMPFVAISPVGKTTICSGEQVNLISISSGASAYQWLRNGTNITGATAINYSATDNGTYSLKASTGLGCTETSNAVVVTRNSLPDSSVTVSGALAFCQGGSVKLSAVTTSGATYQWQRNSSNITNAATSSYDAMAAGDYRMVITNTSTGCMNTSSARSVTVLENPKSDFAATNICSGDTMSFVNNSSAGSSTYQWNFGDGNSSTDKDPKHLYVAAGSYQVTLISASTSGCMDTTTKLVRVYPNPQVGFTATNACDGENMSFANTSSVSSGSLAAFTWAFGDGQTSISVDPLHKYVGAGVYQVTLRATTLLGCKAETTNGVTVSPNPKADFTVSSGCFGDSSYFMNNSTIASGTIAYSWMFGDGTSSSDEAPAHRYRNPGTYNVMLNASSDQGCIGTKMMAVEIYPAPVADFSATTVCAGIATKFMNESTSASDSVEYEWTFGDGTTSTDMSPDHLYASDGSYAVKLKVITENGCMDSIIMSVVVNPMADASFTRIHIGNGAYEFTPSESGLSSYHWDFGDGSSSTASGLVKHQYADYGSFNVRLTVRNSSGCEASSTDLLEYATGLKEGTGADNFIHIYPNPYRESTNITYQLDHTSKVLIEVYSMEGKLVQRLANETQLAGEHRYSFSGKDGDLGSGSFLVRFTIDGKTYMKQIVKVK